MKVPVAISMSSFLSCHMMKLIAAYSRPVLTRATAFLGKDSLLSYSAI